jgi:ribosomal protein S1
VENQKINLGVKQLEKSPISVLKENITAPVKGRVKEIFDRGIIVKVPVGKHKVEGFVPISQLMKQERRETTKAYGIGKEINLMILEVDEKRHRVILSEKKYYEEEERKDYEEYLKRK